MKLSEFEKASRAKRGVIILRELKANPHRIIGFALAGDGDILFLQSEKGIIESTNTSDIRYNDRYSNGSFLMDESDSGLTKEIWLIENENNLKPIE
jgi:topoisomerase IV subunit A